MKQKKFLLLFLIFLISSVKAFSLPGYEFGIGSGYIFYGDDGTREINKALGNGNQIVISTEARMLFPLEGAVYLSLGGDTNYDFRWAGGEHAYHLDYSALFGFRMYPGLAGFVFSIEYALGRRTDFISFDHEDSFTESTAWGNGFRIGTGYDFSVHTTGFAPTLGLALKSMPRGGSRDNMISIFLKFGKRRP